MSDNTIRDLTAGIVSAYVSNNSVQRADLAGVVEGVAAALAGLGKAPEPEPLTPPVSIRKSVTPDFLISLEDGKRYKSLKRHLGVRGLTPDEYRAKWSLPADYPMVAPNYAAARSALAKTSGLGRKPAPKAKPGKRKR
ncbi:MAG: MucR family transcriptional regulator [Rhizobiaceae bacterium]|nr:MucR family transcriptional regulator [Rhizobiaceae bacterium]